MGGRDRQEGNTESAHFISYYIFQFRIFIEVPKKVKSEISARKGIGYISSWACFSDQNQLSK